MHSPLRRPRTAVDGYTTAGTPPTPPVWRDSIPTFSDTNFLPFFLFYYQSHLITLWLGNAKSSGGGGGGNVDDDEDRGPGARPAQ